MNRKAAFMVSGALLGLLMGSSMGIAVGGDAYNAAFFLTPLGGFVGWLIDSKFEKESDNEYNITENDARDTDNLSKNSIDHEAIIRSIFKSFLFILATVWNFHIEVIDKMGLLDTFVRRPFLFAGLAFTMSIFFPPFIIFYFCCWLGASYFGLSAEGKYKARLK